MDYEIDFLNLKTDLFDFCDSVTVSAMVHFIKFLTHYLYVTLNNYLSIVLVYKHPLYLFLLQ